MAQKIGGRFPCLRKRNVDREIFSRFCYTNRKNEEKNYTEGLQKAGLMEMEKACYPFVRPKRKEVRQNRMAQTKRTAEGKSLDSLHRATDTLSAMLAQEVKELNTRQKAARKDGADAGTMKGLKEATAVLKDLAAVTKTLNEQGAEADGAECGVVLLPPVEDV